MAMKDWVKNPNTNKEFKEVKWDKKGTGASLSIVYDGDKWRVWLYDVFDEQGEELSNGFKTKSQALAYAKSYMRKN